MPYHVTKVETHAKNDSHLMANGWTSANFRKKKSSYTGRGTGTVPPLLQSRGTVLVPRPVHNL